MDYSLRALLLMTCSVLVYSELLLNMEEPRVVFHPPQKAPPPPRKLVGGRSARFAHKRTAKRGNR